MSNLVVANFNKFEEAIASINNVILEMEGVRTKLNEGDETLRMSWKGKSSDAYFENSELIRKSFNDYIDGLYILINNLNIIRSEFLNNNYSSDSSMVRE